MKSKKRARAAKSPARPIKSPHGEKKAPTEPENHGPGTGMRLEAASPILAANPKLKIPRQLVRFQPKLPKQSRDIYILRIQIPYRPQ
jgi:hypothetical protein